MIEPARPTLVFCESWSDHEWGSPRVLEQGRHPIRGAYRLVRVTCERCPRSITRTEWLDVVGAGCDQSTGE